MSFSLYFCIRFELMRANCSFKIIKNVNELDSSFFAIHILIRLANWRRIYIDLYIHMYILQYNIIFNCLTYLEICKTCVHSSSLSSLNRLCRWSAISMSFFGVHTPFGICIIILIIQLIHRNYKSMRQ